MVFFVYFMMLSVCSESQEPEANITSKQEFLYHTTACTAENRKGLFYKLLFFLIHFSDVCRRYVKFDGVVSMLTMTKHY